MKFAYQYELEQAYQTLVGLAIKEDIGIGDITTNALGASGLRRGYAEVTVKENWAVICGLKIADILFKSHNRTKKIPSKITYHYRDGDEVSQGKKILTVNASVKNLLLYERIFLNFLQHLSGIATQTRQWSNFLKKVSGNSIRILDTRKTIPGYRLLEKYAVFCGGGLNHRMGLFDQYLIKDNHIEVAQGTISALKKIIAHRKVAHKLQKKTKKILIEIECKTLKELREVLNFNCQQPTDDRVDIVMLDNFTYTQMQSALQLINKTCQVEVSGNMTLGKLKKIATLKNLGINYISAGTLTHSVPAIDLSMNIAYA